MLIIRQVHEPNTHELDVFWLSCLLTSMQVVSSKEFTLSDRRRIWGQLCTAPRTVNCDV